MSSFTNKIKVLKKNRDKQIRKLSKLLKLLVETEWDMVTKSYERNDKITLSASKSVADSSKYIQTAISQLILADFSEIEKSESKTVKTQNIQQLKKVVLGKNK